MKKNPGIRRHFKITNSQENHSLFPVSDFVLNLIPQTARPKTGFRFSFLEQAASLALTIVLCASSFGITYGNPLGTLSYFRDDEASRGNAFAAGLLAFRVNPGDVSITVKPGKTINLSPLFEPKPDSFSIRYRVEAEVIGDETELCSAITAVGTTSPYIYSGTFKDMITEPATTTGHGSLEIGLADVSKIPDGTACTIALVFRGWYENAPENTGYTDEHRDTFTFVLSNPAPKAPEEAAPAQAEEPSTTDQATTNSEENNSEPPASVENTETSQTDPVPAAEEPAQAQEVVAPPPLAENDSASAPVSAEQPPAPVQEN